MTTVLWEALIAAVHLDSHLLPYRQEDGAEVIRQAQKQEASDVSQPPPVNQSS